MPLYESEYENLLRIMREFQATSADVECTMLLTADGIPLMWNFSKEYGDEHIGRIAGLVAAATAVGEVLSDAIWQTSSQMLSFTFENGYLIVVPLYLEVVLAVLARGGAKLGLIFLDIGGFFGPKSRAGIIIRRPPGSLNAGAKPESGDNR